MKLRSVLIATAVALPLLALFLRGLGMDPRYIPPAIPGQPAPPFELERMAYDPEAEPSEPTSVRLDDYLGHVVVVNFWASWCIPCRQEHPALVAAAERYRDQGVVFFGILYQDQVRNARRWLAEMGGEAYPTLLDPGSRTAIDYGLTGVPETVIIDRDGIVSYKRNGVVTLDLLVREIEAALARSEEAA